MQHLQHYIALLCRKLTENSKLIEWQLDNWAYSSTKTAMFPKIELATTCHSTRSTRLRWPKKKIPSPISEGSKSQFVSWKTWPLMTIIKRAQSQTKIGVYIYIYNACIYIYIYIILVPHFKTNTWFWRWIYGGSSCGPSLQAIEQSIGLLEDATFGLEVAGLAGVSPGMFQGKHFADGTWG